MKHLDEPRHPAPPCGHRRLAECPLDTRDWEAVYAAWIGFLRACRMIAANAHERAASALPAPPPA